MNAFTDMRRRFFESGTRESFPEYYLTHRCYVSDQDDVARIADSMAQMVQHASTFAHAGSGDDDEGAGPVIERLRLLRRLDKFEAWELQRIEALAQKVGGFIVIALAMAGIDLGGF